MSALTLYNYELDENSYRVRLLLSMLGVAHEVYSVNMLPGREEKSPALLALNPCGTLPFIEQDGTVIFGAEAILAHLARNHDASAKWLPIDGPDFSATMMWLGFAAGPLQAAVKAREVAVFAVGGHLERLKADARAAFRIMDDHMTLRQIEGEDWFAADYPTIADLALIPSFALSRDFNIDHEEFPALRLWLRRFRRLPGFITMPGIPDYH
ncbi:MAG TPA: glutathione S-transferase family protein [Ensifer sp.]|nr:glutathione S-transferase family protein [Ensifer sp.]